MQKNYLKVTYRDIAKMLASALPIEGSDFGLKVEDNLKAIKSLTIEAKNSLRAAYIFSRKVPKEERMDLFQDIALAVFKTKISDEKLAYAIARCDWQDWWRKYKIRQHYSLDSITEDNSGNPVTLAELIVGEVEFENKVNGKIEAQRIWGLLPVDIKPLVLKRLIGKALTNKERAKMSYFVKTKGTQLLLA